MCWIIAIPKVPLPQKQGHIAFIATSKWIQRIPTQIHSIYLPSLPWALTEGKHGFKLMSEPWRHLFVLVSEQSMLPVLIWFQQEQTSGLNCENLKAHISLQAFVYSFDSAWYCKWILSLYFSLCDCLCIASDSFPFVSLSDMDFMGAA